MTLLASLQNDNEPEPDKMQRRIETSQYKPVNGSHGGGNMISNMPAQNQTLHASCAFTGQA